VAVTFLTLVRSVRAAFLVCAVVVATFTGCGEHELRGKSVRSVDGKTYLAVDDNSGGACSPILVDRKEWPYALRAPGPIEPGVHQIACGDPDHYISFEIKEETTFHFSYWGP
jgi:hypothetical protein